MKLRIYKNKYGLYFPQSRFLWIWWNYVEGPKDFSPSVRFGTLAEAEKFIHEIIKDNSIKTTKPGVVRTYEI
jgi:hypothetical protein